MLPSICLGLISTRRLLISLSLTVLVLLPCDFSCFFARLYAMSFFPLCTMDQVIHYILSFAIWKVGITDL